MKFIKILLLALTLAMVSVSAQAADDARCVDPTQADVLNLSDGSATLCIPNQDANGDVIPAGKSLTCSVVFKDGSGTDIGSESFIGPPGKAFDVSIPSDGVGTAELSCNMDNLTGSSKTVAVTFPSDSAPAPPMILVGS